MKTKCLSRIRCLSTGIALVTKKEGRCISQKCLASANPLKHDQPMNTKNLICILASAVLLVSCAGKLGPWGKRTETGTVIGLTTTQITLQVPSISSGYPGAGTAGTFLITIHTPGDTSTSPSLSSLRVGSTATVSSFTIDWTQVTPAPRPNPTPRPRPTPWGKRTEGTER
jgi:hypothetical protein